jgi:hypothetical protein
MIYKCVAYLFPDGTVMVHGNKDTDYLDRWIHPDERRKAEKVDLEIELNGQAALGKVVNQ